ncbi:CC0125/CC1285 family lipoprotein [Rhodanobacter lindaniclasticus]|nr:hypothetical protein [Rhodanobacter lindaniclasticus]
MGSRMLAMVAAALLGGCATGYHSDKGVIRGYTGGYWEQPGPGELLKVGFSGNGYIDRDTTHAYLMYRCAELALQRHKPYFRLYESLPDAIRDRPSMDLTVGRVAGAMGDWVFVLFDQDYSAGDLDADGVEKRYASYIHAQGGQR